ncbi:acyltransferase family protein [Mucilaginibacter glaciei]|uniref:Acyltransferase n=1 Tax=Mucilaginibacter glaciei TaxID=2772109 RepID=A0A926NRD2_9SPHI|nr:acyltransferase [Mucilaginibacter glaciei]MBD1393320.1 acyltransferase [Mucilaginibacter glaciei]
MELTKDFKVNNFDLLRFLAATQVIFDHYYQHLNIPLSQFGLDVLYLFPGVPVFFVISGFLISASYERNNSIKTYIKNRLLRIYPALWACIIISIIVITITGVSFIYWETLLWLPVQFVGLIYTPQFLKGYGFGSYNGSLWTIPLELQFYVCLPLCYILAPKKGTTYWFIALFVLFAMASALVKMPGFTAHIEKLITYSFVPHFYLFLAGVILQRIQLYKQKLIRGKALYWIIIYAVYSLTLSTTIEITAFTLIKNIILAFSVISLAYSKPLLAKKLLGGNDISYGIYIYHGLILTVMIQEKITINLPVLILTTYAAACLSWVLVERPFLKRKERTIRSQPGG